ncbi:MAG: PHP domain-containing protein [Bacteriovoracia bacterium]
MHDFAPKHEFAEKLRELATLMEFTDANPFRIRALEKGADAVASAEVDLQEMASGRAKVSGIGEGIRGLIKEYIETETLSELEALQKQVPQSLVQLRSIPGLGAKKIIVLNKELGIQSLGELEYACRENRLVNIKGFGAATQRKILRAIDQIKVNSKKMRLDEAKLFFLELSKKCKEKFQIEIAPAGALARSLEVVEVIEVLIKNHRKTKNLENIFDGEFSLEKTKYFSKLKGELTIHLRKFPVHFFFSEKALPDIYFYAEPSILEKVVADAKYENWRASWLEPIWVENRDSIQGLYRLDKSPPVQGIFHCHTTYSDGGDSIEEMIRTAQNSGYSYIGIADHSQSAFYARGLRTEDIQRQIEEVRGLQKKFSIKIFYGIESDILADGSLDYDSKTLMLFDFVIGSIHSRFQMDSEKMTQRICTALENPFMTMWGHPSGRLLLSRDSYGLNWEKVLKTAAQNGVVVELNANPYRLDIDWRYGGLLEKNGNLICINPDAHGVDEIKYTDLGLNIAEKAMIREEQVLNLYDVDRMEKFLWQRKKRVQI